MQLRPNKHYCPDAGARAKDPTPFLSNRLQGRDEQWAC